MQYQMQYKFPGGFDQHWLFRQFGLNPMRTRLWLKSNGENSQIRFESAPLNPIDGTIVEGVNMDTTDGSDDEQEHGF